MSLVGEHDEPNRDLECLVEDDQRGSGQSEGQLIGDAVAIAPSRRGRIG